MTPAPDGPGPDTWMLRPRVGPESTREKIAKPPLLKAVARRGLPGIVEASFVPAAIFLTARSLWDTRWAMIAVLAWGLISVLYRRWRGHRFPTLVVVAFVGLLVRTFVGIASGSTFAYFAQPVATLVGIATVFLLSVLFGRPLVARIAHDFCPISPDLASRPSVIQLFTGLTVLWAGAQLVSAAATVAMLLSMSTSLFVIVKPFVTLGVSAAAVTVTVMWALRVAHRENLEFAVV